MQSCFTNVGKSTKLLLFCGRCCKGCWLICTMLWVLCCRPVCFHKFFQWCDYDSSVTLDSIRRFGTFWFLTFRSSGGRPGTGFGTLANIRRNGRGSAESASLKRCVRTENMPIWKPTETNGSRKSHIYASDNTNVCEFRNAFSLISAHETAAYSLTVLKRVHWTLAFRSRHRPCHRRLLSCWMHTSSRWWKLSASTPKTVCKGPKWSKRSCSVLFGSPDSPQLEENKKAPHCCPHSTESAAPCERHGSTVWVLGTFVRDNLSGKSKI